MEQTIQSKTQLIIKPIMMSLHRVRQELGEIEEELSFLSDQDLLASIKKAESDIDSGKCTCCKTNDEIKHFFDTA
jgi:hypothetical protein